MPQETLRQATTDSKSTILSRQPANVFDRAEAADAPAAPPARFQNNFQMMTESIPQLVWRSGPDGVIDYLSEQWYAFTGVSRPRLFRMVSLNEDWRSVIHADDVEAFMTSWMRSINTGTAFEAECRIHRAGNGYCWHLCRAIAVRDKAGQILSWFGTSTFVDRERREREDMATANRAKDQFLARLSHELRVPLTPALMLIDELASDKMLPPHLLEIVQVLHRNILLEVRLVSDLMDMSAATHGKLPLHREPLDLRDIVQKAMEFCHADFAAKSINVTIAMDAAPSIVIGDSVQLQQVIWNLLKNAAKFTPEGGHVEIGSADADETLVRLWVKDNGMGIAPEMLTRIFAPFEQGTATAAQRFGGLGLGLAIARTIVELHQGSLFGLSDGAGQGATFVVELPKLPAHCSPKLPADGCAECGV